MAEGAKASGVRCFGFTDHLHCHRNLPELRAARAEFDALADRDGLHFGVEVSCLRVWDIEQNEAAGDDAHLYGVWQGGPADGPLTIYWPDEMAELAPEYAVGGAHWPLGVPLEQVAVIRSYHRQQMYLAERPEVTIVAHPWWWMGHWQTADGRYPDLPWLGNFTVVPQSMHGEFAAALRENDTYMELNAEAIFLNGSYPENFKWQYRDYVALMKSLGVHFTLGSDCHAEAYKPCLGEVVEFLAPLGLTEDDFWHGPDSANGVQ